MLRSAVLWGLVLATGAAALQWLDYKHLTRAYPLEIYVAIIAVAFAAGGVWVGWRFAARPIGAFEPNTAAIRSLGLTAQELRVLGHLADGQSNKEIARRLGLSPNTVKTHLANLFAKLEVQRRTQAIRRARELQLIP